MAGHLIAPFAPFAPTHPHGGTVLAAFAAALAASAPLIPSTVCALCPVCLVTHQEGRLSSLDYLVHGTRHRAAPRGVGSTKAAGNYSPCLLAQAEARQQGCHDCLYLDARA